MSAPPIHRHEPAEDSASGWATHRRAITWWAFGGLLFVLLSLVGI